MNNSYFPTEFNEIFNFLVEPANLSSTKLSPLTPTEINNRPEHLNLNLNKLSHEFNFLIKPDSLSNFSIEPQSIQPQNDYVPSKKSKKVACSYCNIPGRVNTKCKQCTLPLYKKTIKVIYCPICDVEGRIGTKCSRCRLVLSEQLLSKKKFCDVCCHLLTDRICRNMCNMGITSNINLTCSECHDNELKIDLNLALKEMCYNLKCHTCITNNVPCTKCYYIKLNGLNMALKHGKPLLEWLSEPFKTLSKDTILGSYFEEVFTFYLKISCWFRFRDLSTNSNISLKQIESIMSYRKIGGNYLRMAKEDTWILQDQVLCMIVYNHLRVILGPLFL